MYWPWYRDQLQSKRFHELEWFVRSIALSARPCLKWFESLIWVFIRSQSVNFFLSSFYSTGYKNSAFSAKCCCVIDLQISRPAATLMLLTTLFHPLLLAHRIDVNVLPRDRASGWHFRYYLSVQFRNLQLLNNCLAVLGFWTTLYTMSAIT